MPILHPLPSAAAAPKRVLLVEHEEAGVPSLEPLLGSLGYVVAGTAPCGEEALRSAERLSPDLVLMDVGVQGPMDPLAAARSIHESLGLPVVFLAGPGDEDALSRAAGAEPFGCILKPFTERDLRISLELALARHESERRLRRSATMSAMGALVAGVAHEVRNPLFGISATIDALEAHLETGGDAGELPQFLAVLRQELTRMTELMQDLLDYGKPAALVPLRSHLAPSLAQAAADCARLAQQHEVEVQLFVPEDLPLLWLDRSRLDQAIRNLLENAIQHSPAGGAVVVEARQAPGPAPAVEVSVQDSGPGFPPGDLPHLFEPFFSRRKGGTGLGLSIVQRVVEEHGGSVAAGNLPGGGARVSLWLPLGDGPSAG